MAQLKKYADDLVEVYQSEKRKTEELHEKNRLLNIAHQQLNEAYMDTICRLSMAAEYKDEDTGEHISRISRYSALLAEKSGLDSKEIHDIRYASPMHDVGKIGIPERILLKPGKLTDEEFEIMKTHTTIGARILANSKAEILNLAHQIAISHHEKWDGTGYPQGLTGESIPLCGRIVGLADVFDALTSKRPYKNPYPVEVALDIIRKGRNHHFDPKLTDIFLANTDAILKIRTEIFADEPVSEFVFSERDRLYSAV
jgi:putative two-component system response regulator